MSSLSIAVAGLFDRSGSTTDVGTDLKVVLKRSEFAACDCEGTEFLMDFV